MNQLDQIVSFADGRDGRVLEGQVTWLERQLRRYVGVKHCVSVPDGATGLYIALKAAGVGRGDRVLCTAFGQYSTLRTILELEAAPVFVDINPNTFNMDPYCLEYVIGKIVRMKEKMPKALVTMDLFGLPCNYTAVEEICERFGIVLIEDMTQAFGASHSGRKAGTFGRFAVTSLHDTKVAGSLEEDGAVFCHTREDDLLLRDLLIVRMKTRGGRETAGEEGGVQAGAILLEEQLSQFCREFERRQRVAALYQERLSGLVKTQQVRESYRSAYSQFVVSLRDNDMRAFAMDRLRQEQIPCSIFYPVPLHRRGEGRWERVHMANAERVAEKLLVLPMHSYLTNHVIDFICEQLVEAVRQCDELPAPKTPPGQSELVEV